CCRRGQGPERADAGGAGGAPQLSRPVDELPARSSGRRLHGQREAGKGQAAGPAARTRRFPQAAGGRAEQGETMMVACTGAFTRPARRGTVVGSENVATPGSSLL